jgi:hypothetical protein
MLNLLINNLNLSLIKKAVKPFKDEIDLFLLFIEYNNDLMY